MTVRTQPSAFAVLRKPSFGLLWVAQLVSTAGGALTTVTASILVYRLTGSALNVGLMMMAQAVPSLIVGLVAGVFVDRMDRKRVMLTADLIRALLVFSIPFLMRFDIAWLYILVIVASAVGQFFDPAHASILPEVASDEELAAASALMQISTFGSAAVGFAASGLIASRYPIEWAFYLDAATFLFSVACISLVRIPPLVVEGKTSMATVIDNLQRGLRFLFETPILRSLFLVLVPSLVGIGLLNALLLPFALRALRTTEFAYGLMEALSSLGFVIGALALVWLADRLHPGQWVAVSYIAVGLICVAFSQNTSIPFAIFLYTVGGLANAPNYVARSVIIQRNTPREIRGRVNSSFLVLRNVMFMVGMASASLADLYGPRPVYLLGALAVLGGGLLALALPGLGQSAAEWRGIVAMLRAAPSAPRLGLGRAATLADVDLLAAHLSAMAGLGRLERQQLASQSRSYDVEAGTVVVGQDEIGDAAYFVLDGRTVASRRQADRERVLEIHNAGDFFGEIAALTGTPRTAIVIAEQRTHLLQIPAPALRHLALRPEIQRLLFSKMTERMIRMGLATPLLGRLDQESLRELRTPAEVPTSIMTTQA